MEEKTAMTIDFLRARLLSERTISRTARQRAELLTRRVMELEEQLRIVNIQRKKAEKATKEIVTILETQGITCISGSANSSSEQEDIHCKSSDDVKDDEGLTASRTGGSEIDDASSFLDIDGCSQYTSLSWKSRGHSLDTQEKQNARQDRHRQRNNFIFTVKSSQQHPGKSCRKIKRRDVGEREEAGSGKDDGMERALEQQAQLIGQFEVMENAQREWEEKFFCSEIPILGESEPGDQVSVAENSNWSEENNKLVDKVEQDEEEEERLNAKHISFTEEKIAGRCRNCEATNKKVESSDKFLSSDSMPTSPVLNTVKQNGTNSMNDSKNVSQVFRYPSGGSLGLSAKKADIQGSIYEKPSIFFHTDQRIHPDERVIHQNIATAPHAPINGGKISNEKKPEIKMLPKKLIQPSSSSLDSVIISLQRARISLRKEIIKRPSSSQGTLTSAPADFPDVPVGHSGLFRLPTDSFPQAQLPGPNVYGSGLRLSATRPDLGFISSSVSAGKGYVDPSLGASYVDAGSRALSQNDYSGRYPIISHMDGKQCLYQYPTRYLENRSQLSMAKNYSDRLSSSGLTSPSPSEYFLPYSGFPTKRIPSNNDLPIPYTDLRNRMPY